MYEVVNFGYEVKLVRALLPLVRLKQWKLATSSLFL